MNTAEFNKRLQKINPNLKVLFKPTRISLYDAIVCPVYLEGLREEGIGTETTGLSIDDQQKAKRYRNRTRRYMFYVPFGEIPYVTQYDEKGNEMVRGLREIACYLVKENLGKRDVIGKAFGIGDPFSYDWDFKTKAEKAKCQARSTGSPEMKLSLTSYTT